MGGEGVFFVGVLTNMDYLKDSSPIPLRLHQLIKNAGNLGIAYTTTFIEVICDLKHFY